MERSMDAPVAAGRWRSVAWPAVVVALLLVALLCTAHRYCTYWAAFNTDDLLPIQVGLDVLGRGYELRQYHLPSAPYVFPDLPLVVGCLAASKAPATVFLIYSVLFHGLLLVTLTALFRQTGLGLREAFLFAGSGLLLFLVVHLGDPYLGRLAVLARPMNHAGVILVGLFLSLLVVRDLHRRTGWRAAAGFVVVGGLGLFSDKLLLPQFLAPLGLMAVVLGAFRVLPARKAGGILLLIGAAVAASVGVQRAFAHYLVLLPPDANFQTGEIAASWRGFLENLPLCVKGQHLLQILCLVFIPAAGVVALCSLWAARGKRLGGGSRDEASRCQATVAAVALIALLSGVCNVGAVVVSGIARLGGFDRYLLAAELIPFLCTGVCCRFLPGRPLQWLGRACPALVVLYAAAALGIGYRPAFSFGDLRPPYPETARVLDRLAREHKLGHGLANFWNARSLHCLTEEHVQLRTLEPNGEPWLHTQTPYAYLTPGRQSLEVPPYNFILFNEHDIPPGLGSAMKRDKFERRFGTPRERVAAGPCEVWLYDGILNTGLNLFLRSTLASRCRCLQPYVGPASPASLGVPKENGTSVLRPGTVLLAPDGVVKLTFTQAVTGEVIDVGACYNAHFDLLFYRDEELLGKVYVPRVNVPEVSASYHDAGNQSRLLSLPSAMRGRAWTSVVVRAGGGDGCFALCHFLVYPKTPPGLRTRQALPGGHWLYEAETQPGDVPGAAAVATDPAASGGRARFAPGDFAGCVVHGPYAFLDRGRYRIDFFVKAAPDAAGGRLARLEVTSAQGGVVHAKRELTAADFGGDGYCKFSLALEADVELSDCEFRVFSYAKAPLYVDRVELDCEE
jgi:hypothetical protein